MGRKYRGREWRWWIILNSHNCRFCHEKNIHISLGRQTGMNMTQSGYWRKLYQVWLRHMRKYHPKILAGRR